MAKTRWFVVILIAAVLAAVCLTGDDPIYVGSGTPKTDAGYGFPMENLCTQKGVTVTADSVEADAFAPKLAIDGDRTGSASRWSSANDPASARHWLCLEFPQQQTFSFVRIYWERLNVEQYVIEVSEDGSSWETAASFTHAPEESETAIVLDHPRQGRFLRLRTEAVSQSETDNFLYYQNVSLYELEVYAETPVAYSLKAPLPETRADGSRYLTLPSVPEGYEIELAGANPEGVVGPDGLVYPTWEETTVTVGYLVSKDGRREESPGIEVTLPASRTADTTGASVNAKPKVVPALQEWSGANGRYKVSEDTEIVVEAGEAGLLKLAETLQEDYLKQSHTLLPVRILETEKQTETKTDVDRDAGHDDGVPDSLRSIELRYTGDDTGLGAEGYMCEIDTDLLLSACTDQGLYYGTRTLLSLLSEDGSVPGGVIRDYPRYQVRGFAVDVARRFVPLETLYTMIGQLAQYKMNELQLHLNDNEILATSGLNDTIKNAFTAYSGFRLESQVQNAQGVGITSTDGSYSPEEMKALISYAADLGVRVIPEIDTPAHSLAFTRVFPEYALADEPDNVDHLNLSKKGTVDLVQQIWSEYLDGETPVFPPGGTVHIGMDEYFGNGEDYRSYVNTMADYIRQSGRTVRMWGSLDGIAGSTQVAAVGQEGQTPIQLQVWNTDWADPKGMYRQGFGIINSLSTDLYIIPGGGYDWLDTDDLEDSWQPNRFCTNGSAQLLPAWSDRMLGAVYIMWNDTIGKLDAGITQEDMLQRFEKPLPAISGKLW